MFKGELSACGVRAAGCCLGACSGFGLKRPRTGAEGAALAGGGGALAVSVVLHPGIACKEDTH